MENSDDCMRHADHVCRVYRRYIAFFFALIEHCSPPARPEYLTIWLDNTIYGDTLACTARGLLPRYMPRNIAILTLKNLPVLKRHETAKKAKIAMVFLKKYVVFVFCVALVICIT